MELMSRNNLMSHAILPAMCEHSWDTEDGDGGDNEDVLTGFTPVLVGFSSKNDALTFLAMRKMVRGSALPVSVSLSYDMMTVRGDDADNPRYVVVSLATLNGAFQRASKNALIAGGMAEPDIGQERKTFYFHPLFAIASHSPLSDPMVAWYTLECVTAIDHSIRGHNITTPVGAVCHRNFRILPSQKYVTPRDVARVVVPTRSKSECLERCMICLDSMLEVGEEPSGSPAVPHSHNNGERHTRDDRNVPMAMRACKGAHVAHHDCIASLLQSQQWEKCPMCRAYLFSYVPRSYVDDGIWMIPDAIEYVYMPNDCSEGVKKELRVACMFLDACEQQGNTGGVVAPFFIGTYGEAGMSALIIMIAAAFQRGFIVGYVDARKTDIALETPVQEMIIPRSGRVMDTPALKDYIVSLGIKDMTGSVWC